MKKAHNSSSLPPLGDSDHNLIHFDTTYSPVVGTAGGQQQDWSKDAEEALRECFNVTDWGLFEEDFGDSIEDLSRCITDCIKSCEDIVPTEKVSCFSNNKPWINKDIKGLLNRKKRAFMAKDRKDLRTVQKELKRKLREARNSYKENIEAKMGQKKMAGCGKPTSGVKGGREFATELNLFFSRFDTTPVSSDCGSGSPSPTTAPIHTSALGSASLPINISPPFLSLCLPAVSADSPPTLHHPIPFDIDTTTVISPQPPTTHHPWPHPDLKYRGSFPD